MRITIIFLFISLLTACVYIPHSTEIDKTHYSSEILDKLIGKNEAEIVSELGKPKQNFIFKEKKYLLYRVSGKHTYTMAGLAPFYIPFPFAETVTEDVYVCVKLNFNLSDELLSYQKSDWSWKRRCIDHFWRGKELEEIKTNMIIEGDARDVYLDHIKEKAYEGD